MNQKTATTTTTTTTTRKTAATAPILIHLPTPDHPPLAAILVIAMEMSLGPYCDNKHVDQTSIQERKKPPH